MAGKCKYCGFVGTQDEIVDHAGSCPVMLKDFQPDDIGGIVNRILVIGDSPITRSHLELRALINREPELYNIRLINNAEEPAEIYPKYGGEMLINKPTGNGFCLGCNARRGSIDLGIKDLT